MSSKQTSKQQLKALKQVLKRRWKILAGIFIAICLIGEFTYYGNIAYLSMWKACGTQPVIYQQGPPFITFGASPDNISISARSGFFDEKVVSGDEMDRYYCTLDEAKARASREVYSTISISN